MKKIYLSLLLVSVLSTQLKAQITKTFTLDSLGACQGISYINGEYAVTSAKKDNASIPIPR